MRSILQALVDEWGKEEVTETLGVLTRSSLDPTGESATKPKRRRSTVRMRLSATGQIQQLELEGEKKEALLRLAERYDLKRFLPSVADVREFLTMMDERPIGMKDRKEAFRTLLRSLMRLPVERLRQLALTAQHSGPSELGPLSDAIAAAGGRLPRRQQANHGEPKWRPELVPTIFFDTNVLRYFARAFRDTSVDPELKQHFAVSPISLLELLSELATSDANQAFQTVRALPNIFDTDRLPLLPWEDDVFRVLIFNLPQPQSRLPELLGNATRRVFDAKDPDDIKEDARQLREMMDQGKFEATEDFARLLNSWRAHGGVADEEHRRIFATSIARRAGLPPEGIDVDNVIEKLNALWVYEQERLTNAAAERAYEPHRHENDVYDAQQLVYLAHPGLHFLTCDRGFRKAAGALQFDRIHWEPNQIFENPVEATRVMRSIILQ
jgi:hypothetical protein